MTERDDVEVAAALEVVQNEITDAGGDPDRVRVIAVTKAFDHRAVEVAIDAGITDVGESYVQEFAEKVDVLGGGSYAERARSLHWHFIGRLQTNKVRSLPDVDLIHSVDRVSLVKELAKRRPGQQVLVQVNIGDEEQKGGAPLGDTPDLVARAVDGGLDVRGLMGVARLAPPDDTRAQFESLVRLADDLDLPERSIGMSADLAIAVAAGATMVRIGTALFGPRPAW